jgi:hypothetical protein
MESLIHHGDARVEDSIIAQLKQMNAIIHDLHIVSQVSATITDIIDRIQVCIMSLSCHCHYYYCDGNGLMNNRLKVIGRILRH